MTFLKKKLLTLTLVVSLGGCALLGGGGTEIKRASGYQVNAPASWTVKSSEGESDSTYQTPAGNLVTVTSSCQRKADQSLDVLTRQLLIGARKVSVQKRQKMTVAGAPGLYTQVQADMEGTRFNLDLFVLSKNKCVFDFSLIGKKQFPDQDRSDFLSFIETFDYGTN